MEFQKELDNVIPDFSKILLSTLRMMKLLMEKDSTASVLFS